jgi:hypothetical protein
MNHPESNSREQASGSSGSSGSSRRAFLKASSFASVLAGTPGILGGLIATAGSANALITTAPVTTTAPPFTHTYQVDGSHDGTGSEYPAVIDLLTHGHHVFASLWASSSPAVLPAFYSGTVYFKVKGGHVGDPASYQWGPPLSVTGWLDAAANFYSGVDDDDNGSTTNPTTLVGETSEVDLFTFGGTVGSPGTGTVKAVLEVLSDDATSSATKRSLRVKVGIKEFYSPIVGSPTEGWLPAGTPGSGEAPQEFDIWVKRVPETAGTGGGGPEE